MKKLLIILMLAAVSLGTGCVYYVRGDLDYYNMAMDKNKEPKKIAYRVNTNFYSKMYSMQQFFLASILQDESKPYNQYDPMNMYTGLKGDLPDVQVLSGNRTWVMGQKEKNIINKVVGDLFSSNVLYTEKTLGKKPENLFFDVSVMFHEVSDKGDHLAGAMISGLTLWLFPNRFSRHNIYYAVDVYDKSQVSSPEGASIALGDIRTIKPIARYEYQHVICGRMAGLILGALFIPWMAADNSRALNRAVTDMTKEFMSDLKDGRKSIVSHNHWRGARGLSLALEQIGDGKEEYYAAAIDTAAAGMMAASSAMNTYASMQKGVRPGTGMQPGMQYLANTTAVLRTTKELSLVAKAAKDMRTEKKNLANKKDNMDERLFASEGNAFPNKGGVKLWWYTYKMSTTGDQQYLAYFTGPDVVSSNASMMVNSPNAYTLTSKIETQTFGSPSAAVQFIRSKAKQIGDKRYMDIKL